MGGTFRDNGWEDREVKVARDELLKVLRDNRTKHVAEYKQACAGYCALAIEKIEQAAEDTKRKIGALKEGKMIAVPAIGIGLEVPVNHEAAYNQIIRMMEMSVDKEIVLTAGQFACFVMDDWAWKRGWEQTVATYTSSRR